MIKQISTRRFLRWRTGRAKWKDNEGGFYTAQQLSSSSDITIQFQTHFLANLKKSEHRGHEYTMETRHQLHLILFPAITETIYQLQLTEKWNKIELIFHYLIRKM